MSWSASFKVIEGDVDEDSVSESNVDIPQHSDQYEEALGAVWALLRTGAFGDSDETDFQISLSGHGNPGHVPVAGWSNDSLTISIYQLSTL